MPPCAIAVTIGGTLFELSNPVNALTDRGPYISDARGVQFTETLGNRGTASFTLVVPNFDYEPSMGDLVVIWENVDPTQPLGPPNNPAQPGYPVFCGTLDSKKKTRMANVTTGWPLQAEGFWIECAAVSLESLFDKRMTSGFYVDENPGDIVTAILSALQPQETPFAVVNGIPQNAFIDFQAPNITIGWPDPVRVTDALDQIANQVNYVWEVLPNAQFMFGPRSTFKAPFAVTSDIVLWESGSGASLDMQTNRADLRNRQHVRHAYSAVPAERFTQGDGILDVPVQFKVRKPVAAIQSITITNAFYASGAIAGGSVLSSDGDTLTIQKPSGSSTISQTYTFKATIDNTQPYQIQLPVTGAKLADAINNTGEAGSIKGIDYSWPTPTNFLVSAAVDDSGNVQINALDPGADGNNILVTFAGGYSNSFNLALGMDATSPDITAKVGQYDPVTQIFSDATADYSFAAGSDTIIGKTTQAAPLIVVVAYYPIGGDTVTCEDSVSVAARASMDGGSGVYENLIDDSQNGSFISALVECQGILAAYSKFAYIAEFMTDQAGLLPGMLVSALIPEIGLSQEWLDWSDGQTSNIRQTDPGHRNFFTFLHNPPRIFRGPDLPPTSDLQRAAVDVLVHQIDAQYDSTHSTRCSFRYKVTCIVNTRLGTWLQWWAQIAKGAAGSLSFSLGQSGITGAGGNEIEIHIQNGDGDVTAGQDTDLLPLTASRTVTAYRAICGKAAAGAPLVVVVSQNGTDVITISIATGGPAWNSGTFAAVTFAPGDQTKARIDTMGSAGGLVSIVLS